MSVVIVGGGVWGRVLARKVEEAGEAPVIVDPNTVLELNYRGLPAAQDLGGVMQVMAPKRAIVATPPSTHLDVVRILVTGGVKDIRVEKPCGSSLAECFEIADAAAPDTVVSVGYQCLVRRGWRKLLGWVKNTGAEVQLLEATRTSVGEPRHDVSAMLDLGAHGAAYAADLRRHGVDVGEVRISASHGAPSIVRRTVLYTRDHGIAMMLEQHDRDHLILPGGETLDVLDEDPLARDIDAWMQGAPNVGVEVAADAHQIMEACS